jgi:hypothetical protein
MDKRTDNNPKGGENNLVFRIGGIKRDYSNINGV